MFAISCDMFRVSHDILNISRNIAYISPDMFHVSRDIVNASPDMLQVSRDIMSISPGLSFPFLKCLAFEPYPQWKYMPVPMRNHMGHLFVPRKDFQTTFRGLK